MSATWQNWAAAAVVLAAVMYLATLAWRTLARRRAAGCGSGCGKCPGTTEPEVVSLAAPRTKQPPAARPGR